MGAGAGASRGSAKYRRSSPPPRSAAERAAAFYGERPREARAARAGTLRARLQAAQRSVQQALQKEAASCILSWRRIEEELRRSFAEWERAELTRGPEAQQVLSVLRAAAMVRDSTQLGLALQRAASLGLRCSRELPDAVERLLAHEEAEGLWCCLSSALVEADCAALACWLEEARSKDMAVPSEVHEFWLEAMQAVGHQQGAATESVSDWDYRELFEARTAEAHARGDREELRRLIAEARRFGVDSALAEAALIALEADSREAGPSRPAQQQRQQPRSAGPGAAEDLDPELEALRGRGGTSLDAELSKLGVDLRGARDQAELLRMLRDVGAKRSAALRRPRAAEGARDGAAAGAESPRSRLARALRETRAGSPGTAERPPRAGAGAAAGGGGPEGAGGAARRRASSKEAYPGAWQGAARERVRPSQWGPAAGGQEGAASSNGEGGPGPEAGGGARNSGHGGGEEEERQGEREEEAAPPRRGPPALSRAEALERLGLSGDPAAEDVQRAYKRAALQWHPDRQQNHGRQEEATRRFQEVRAAFELLRAGGCA